MKEEWKNIKGYEGRYQVSNLGRIKSLDYQYERPGKRAAKIVKVKGRIRKVRTREKGNQSITLLNSEGKKMTHSIHHLVAYAFIGNPPKPTGPKSDDYGIDHLDGDASNNKVDNLEWVTNAENTLRSFGKSLDSKEELSDKDKLAIKALKETNRFSNRQIARIFKITSIKVIAQL